MKSFAQSGTSRTRTGTVDDAAPAAVSTMEVCSRADSVNVLVEISDVTSYDLEVWVATPTQDPDVFNIRQRTALTETGLTANADLDYEALDPFSHIFFRAVNVAGGGTEVIDVHTCVGA